VAVVSAHQVRLRSTAHPSHVLDRLHWHGAILAFSSQQSEFSPQHSAKTLNRNGRKGRKGMEIGELPSCFASFAFFAVNRFG
jgi:hypothetical protein